MALFLLYIMPHASQMASLLMFTQLLKQPLTEPPNPLASLSPVCASKALVLSRGPHSGYQTPWFLLWSLSGPSDPSVSCHHSLGYQVPWSLSRSLFRLPAPLLLPHPGSIQFSPFPDVVQALRPVRSCTLFLALAGPLGPSGLTILAGPHYMTLAPWICPAHWASGPMQSLSCLAPPWASGLTRPQFSLVPHWTSGPTWSQSCLTPHWASGSMWSWSYLTPH